MTDNAPELTPEEKAKELNGRIESFNKELIPLLAKYELGLGASAFLTPEGNVSARPIVFDMRGQKPAGETTEVAAEAAPASDTGVTAA